MQFDAPPRAVPMVWEARVLVLTFLGVFGAMHVGMVMLQLDRDDAYLVPLIAAAIVACAADTLRMMRAKRAGWRG